MSKTQISELVEKYVNHHPLPGNRIEVLGENIHQQGDWWYVPVRLEREIPKTFQYYEELTEIEDDIRNNEQMDILLVPAD